MATAKLEYEPMESSSNAKPFVVHFTNATLKQNKGDGKIRFGCYQWADRADQRKKQRRTLIAETEDMEYSGQNFGQFSRSNGLCKYVVGVYNKRTEVMKMYDTEMITLQPQILAGTAETNQEDDDQDSKLDLSFLEKSDLLTEAFGSNKKKRNMVSRQRNKVDKDELNETVSDFLETLAKEPLDTTDGREEEHSSIPPFNINAETAADVYKLDDIITPLEYEALKRTSLEITSANKEKINEWRERKRFPEYVLQHLDGMSLNPSQRLHQSCCLLYLSYMMTLYSLNFKDLRKTDPLPGIPEVIKERLLSTFSLEKGKARAVPKRLKDKLVSYILVLALMIDEFTLDCMVIMKDLKMSLSRLSNHLRAVGCVIKSSKVPGKRKLEDGSVPSKTAVLKVPLPPNFQNSSFPST
ncbi:hypothetical protein ACROYT_G018044 [Oculina patagonica]